MDTVNSRVLHIFIVIGILFAALASYLTWFEVQGKNTVMENAYNKRLTKDEAEIQRGSIFDRNGLVLAQSEKTEKGFKRVYPYNQLYAHVIGYNSKTYGKYLLEARFNDALLGRKDQTWIEKIQAMMSEEKKVGNNLTLTIDTELQKYTSKLLGGKSGSVVAIDPKTGEILALVSAPDYDPNAGAMASAWSKLTQDETKPLLPRAVSGTYPPGSTFKVLTSVAAIEAGLEDETVNDNGKIVIDGMTIRNYHGGAHGNIDMEKALTVSSNVYYAKISQKIGAKALIEKAKLAGIGVEIPFDIPLKKSKIGAEDMGKTELAATALGQGKLMVTPLQMAMICAGIANDGVIMEPHLVKTISDSKGNVIKTVSPKNLYQFTNSQTAQKVTSMMTHVVEDGTGSKAAISGYTVAGKTGTAQNEKSMSGKAQDHAWFIGFAPAEDPKIVVAVILEYDGKSGGKTAAPIAGKVMEQWLKKAN